MTVHRRELEARFRPLRPASLPKLLLAAVLGPAAWVLAFLLASLLFSSAEQIVIGYLVTVASLLIAAIVLVVLRRGRDVEERRYGGPT